MPRGYLRMLFLVVVSALAACQGPPRLVRPALGVVRGYLTDAAGARLLAGRAVPWRLPEPASGAVVSVDDATAYQSIDGFGASFLEAGLVTLNTLPTRAAQDGVLRALFDPVTGAGFSVMKTEIGATDFMSAQPRWFTLDDTPGDTELRDFSIARDEGPDGELTFIRRARAVGGVFDLEASMDYPPDWMLTAVTPLTEQHVDPAAYPVLARSYLRYLRAYQAAGVPIDALILFNEPGVYTKISSDALNTLLRDHVGPLLRPAFPRLRIVPAELGNRTSIVDYYAPLRADPATRRYTDTLAYHGYWGDGAAEVARMHAADPGIPLWMTEICCMPDVPGSSDPRRSAYSTGEFWAGQIIADLTAGASAWLYWNMILDESGGPWLVSPEHFDNGPNAQNAVVHIDRRTHAVTYPPLYWYLAHFSRFVRPGAVRTGCVATGAPPTLSAISFLNVDASRVLVLVNRAPGAQPVQVRWMGRQLVTSLPAHSISTLVWG
jgi:O-glycosyl hydrolase